MIEAALILGFSAIAFLVGGMLTLRGAVLRVRAELYGLLARGAIGTVDAQRIIDTLEGRI